MCIIKTGVMNMDYTLMLCGKDAFSYFFFVDLPPPAAQLGQMAKTRQKIRWENSWNWLAILIPGTVWQIFNMKQWPETEIKWICWKLVWKKLVKSYRVFSELTFGGFWSFGTTVHCRGRHHCRLLQPVHLRQVSQWVLFFPWPQCIHRSYGWILILRREVGR